KRDVFEKRILHVFIESSPSAVFVLKAQQPADHALIQSRVVLVASGMGREEHHGSVVHIGAERIIEFKTPAGRFRLRIIHCPIAGDAHLLCQKPTHRLAGSEMVLANSRTRQGDQRDGGVPDWRKTGLDSKTLLVIDEKFPEIGLGLLVNRMTWLISDA